MLTNDEKIFYLQSLYSNMFADSELKYMDSLGEVIRQININDTPKGQPVDKSFAAPVIFNQRCINHPSIERHVKESERHKYRKPIVVKTPRLKEELAEVVHRYDIFNRRRKAIFAFTKRMLWVCKNFADLSLIQPSQFREHNVFELAANILDNRGISYEMIAQISKDEIDRFHTKEKEAIKKIEQHILIEQLTG